MNSNNTPKGYFELTSTDSLLNTIAKYTEKMASGTITLDEIRKAVEATNEADSRGLSYEPVVTIIGK